MVSVPGMFRAGFFIFPVVSLAQQTVMLDVIDGLEHEDLPGADHTAGDGAENVAIDRLVEPSGIFIMVGSDMDVVASDMDHFVVWVKQEGRRDSLKNLIGSFLRMQ